MVAALLRSPALGVCGVVQLPRAGRSDDSSSNCCLGAWRGAVGVVLVDIRHHQCNPLEAARASCKQVSPGVRNVNKRVWHGVESESWGHITSYLCLPCPFCVFLSFRLCLFRCRETFLELARSCWCRTCRWMTPLLIVRRARGKMCLAQTSESEKECKRANLRGIITSSLCSFWSFFFFFHPPADGEK